MRAITTVDDLEQVVGGRLLPAMLKSIDDLDEHCDRLLAASPVGVLGHHETGGAARATVVGGAAGFAVARTPTSLAVALPAGLEPAPGSPVSTLFLVPGLGETLRVNGHVESAEGGELVVAVGEAFLHCAKCVIRSHLWDVPGAAASSEAAGVVPDVGPLAAAGVVDLLGRSPFVVLASCDARGRADASPKGDPPGFVRVLDGHRVALPDRPGNRRTDTFHNLVERPDIALVALVPGDDRVVELSGTAAPTDDADLRASMAVGGRVPKAALVIDVDRAWVRTSTELAAAALWRPDRPDDAAPLPDVHRAWVDHVKRNKTRGVGARAARTLVNERMMRAGLARDYERKLY